MGKADDAKMILVALGLPPAQQTGIAAYTLLALVDVGEKERWKQAKRRSIKIHDILRFIKINYGKSYAENTRETVRRQVLHQLEQARVVDRNPDEPSLATNSPRTHYALSAEALAVVRFYGTRRFTVEAKKFQENQGALLEIYKALRAKNLIPLQLPSGVALVLSAGKHNQLQAAVIQSFAPRFVSDATVLYLGDAANKTLYVEGETLERFGVPVTKHDKLPDLVLYSSEKKWLLLIEAVTSHGPVSPKRKREIEQMLNRCTEGRVYISAFPDISEFRRHLPYIAWETEVWIADMPDHMIHFNGEKFLGPATN